ncbi:MAG: hypothetical protein QM533_00830 [Cytophagales bacterium]|nr:hypothetical protein [Cytophagales bacterium]
MRTTLDFPNELFVHLKTRAAIDGVTLRETVIGLLEKGLAAVDAPAQIAAEPRKYDPPPTIPSKGPMAISMKTLSNADLYELLDAETLERDAFGAARSKTK